jgi:hypothetical protein
MAGRFVSQILCGLALGTMLSGIAFAQGNSPPGNSPPGNSPPGNSPPGNSNAANRDRVYHAPEFDPLASGAVAVIVAGGAIVLARRRGVSAS